MSYGLNISRISLQAFKGILNDTYLIPSMRVLLEDMDSNFDKLTERGISNVETMYLKTKTKKKAELLAEEIGLDLDYMIVLRRMVSSYIPKPRKLAEYPDIDDALCNRLLDLKIKSSVDLFGYLEGTDPSAVKEVLNIEEEAYCSIKALMAVTRLRYVSPLFATVLVRSGYDSIEKIAAGRRGTLHDDILNTNEKQHIYKGNIGDSDAQFLIDDAGVFLKYNGVD